MARVTKTSDYLDKLQKKGYSRCNDLLKLYDRWKKDLDIKTFSKFLDTIWEEKGKIKPTYLGENTYNYFRGVALEEFCFSTLNKALEETETENILELFWNGKILTEEFYVFENGQFKKYTKDKAVDIAIGKSEGGLINPLIIVGCKIYHSTNWLDEDRAFLDNIRNRYPKVRVYSLCWRLNAPPESLIGSQRTGLKVFELVQDGKFSEFIGEIKEVLARVKKNTF